MRALKLTDVKEGSVIAFLYSEKGRYRLTEGRDEKTGLGYRCTIPVDQTPKIRTLKIGKIEKKDNTQEVVGYKVWYGTYVKGFESSSKQLESLSANEMNRLLSHARLIQS
jgi:hypothetical protein